MDETGRDREDRCRMAADGGLLAYCLAKPGAWQDEPWEGDIVAKVGPPATGKIFAFLGDGTSVGVKCATRDEAHELTTRYPDAVTPMAYIGRHGWNTIRTDGGVAPDELLELIDASYDQVVARLPRAQRPSPG